MSRLTQFFKGIESDNAGRLISTIHKFSDDELEQVHDYIQWIFPLPEASAFQPAELLTADDVAEIRASMSAQMNLHSSFAVMVSFYIRNRHLIAEGNHNLLRLTRIIRCLKLLRRHREVDTLMLFLSEFDVPLITRQFWEKAARSEPLVNEQTQQNGNLERQTEADHPL